MKAWAWGAVAVFAATLTACAGGGNSGEGGAGGTGGATSSGSSMGTGSPTSTGTNGTGGAGPGCGSLEFSSDAMCQGCMETACCVELNDCDVGTQCNDVIKCAETNKCQDQACLNNCVMQVGGGATEYNALSSCFQGSCQMECTPVGICGSQYSYQNKDCNTCLSNGCCDSFNACTADMACVDCLTNANAMGCDTNMLFQAFMTCRSGSCGATCGVPICDSPWVLSGPKAPQCGTCLSTNCCAEYKACTSGSKCAMCLTSATPAADCAQDMAYTALTMCESSKCQMDCN